MAAFSFFNIFFASFLCYNNPMNGTFRFFKVFPKAFLLAAVLVFSAQFAVAAPAAAVQDKAALAIDLPPAPAMGSEVDKADNVALHKWQDERTTAQCKAAAAERDPEFQAIFGDLNPFVSPMPDAVKKVIEQVKRTGTDSYRKIKDDNKRPRPFLVDKSLDPCIGRPGGYSYPSGHATLARLYGRLLAEAVPERKAEFIARADLSALYRVIGGVHNPSDIEAGKNLADMVFDQMLADQRFAADVEALKQYVK